MGVRGETAGPRRAARQERGRNVTLATRARDAMTGVAAAPGARAIGSKFGDQPHVARPLMNMPGRTMQDKKNTYEYTAQLG